MAEGERDAFVENDVIGNYAVGTSFLGSVSSRRTKRKSRKSRRKVRHSSKRRKRSYHRSNKRSVSKRSKSKKGRKYPHWLKKYWFKKRK